MVKEYIKYILTERITKIPGWFLNNIINENMGVEIKLMPISAV